MNPIDARLKLAFALTASLGACGGQPQPPTVTTVCDLQAHTQQAVQLDVDISVDSSGGAVISDAHCAATKVQLQLSAAATRAGVGERLTAASQNAARGGHTSFPARVTGVFWNASTGNYFVAESIAGI